MTVEALRRRRPETLADLLSAYGRELQAVAYLILRDRAEAEDVVIETLLTAFERGGVDPRRARAPGVAPARRDQQGARDAGARRPASIRLDLDARATPARATWPPNPRPGWPCSTGVADLPLQMRAAIVLRYYADLSVEEVAATLGKSPNTIKAQLQTGLDRLRVHLADPVGPSLGEARDA